MAFVEIVKNKFRTHIITIKPMMNINVSKDGLQHIYIRLPNDLVHATWGDKMFNDRRSVRLGVLEGTESDAGSFMLVHNPRGYTFTASALSKADDTPSAASFVTKMQMSAFKNYVPNVTPQLPTEMEYSVDGQAMLLLTPSWFIYTPKVAVRSTMVPVEKAPRVVRPQASPTNSGGWFGEAIEDHITDLVGQLTDRSLLMSGVVHHDAERDEYRVDEYGVEDAVRIRRIEIRVRMWGPVRKRDSDNC